MPAERIKELEDEVSALKEANDALYRQHANEKAQMQLAIEQEKLQVAELMEANTAFRDENDQWRASYDALETSKRENEEAWEGEKRAMEEKILALEESVQTYTTELVSDLQEIEREKNEIESRDQTISELQQQLNDGSDRFSQLMTEYDAMSVSFHQLSSEKAAREQQYLDLESRLRDYAAQLESQIAELRSQLQAMSQNEEVKESNHHALLARAEHEASEKSREIERLMDTVAQLEKDASLFASVSGAGEGKSNLLETIRDLQEQLFQKSDELVKQGEKHLQMAASLDKMKRAYQGLEREVDGVRSMLLKGIIGDGVDEAAYKHVKLGELVRLRLKSLENELRVLNAATSPARCSPSCQQPSEIDNELEVAAEENDQSPTDERPRTHLSNVESFSAVESFGAVGRLERELRLAKSRNKRQQAHIEQLEREVEAAMNSLNEFQALKERTVEIVSRERVEKELRAKAEANYKEAADKIVALSEHIEKVMVHLKHEAAAKTKAVDLHRRTEKELSECKEKLALMTKKNGVKDQQIQELEQGAKILEDQLRLMDEKFIDVRNKLDWTRATSQKEIKRLQTELNGLRMKWQMASDLGALSSLPDWVSTPKIKPKSKPLGASSSEPRLVASTNNNAPQTMATGGLSPLRTHSAVDPMTMRFEIPKLPQPDSEAGTPWSDAKLGALQRQLQEKRKL